MELTKAESVKEKARAYARAWYWNNRERGLAKSKEWQRKNRDKVIEMKKLQNRKRTVSGVRRTPEWRNKQNAYRAKRYATDEVFKLTHNARRRLHAALISIGVEKRLKSFGMIGCTPEQLRDHLQSQFKQGMGWHNYGYHGWHVDHKIPLSSASCIEELERLCHYTNLQPLWKQDNLLKHDRID